MFRFRPLFFFSFILVLLILVCISGKTEGDSRIIEFRADPKQLNFAFYHSKENGERFGSIASLQQWMKTQGMEMAFAMNGGMYMENHKPLGLFIEKGKSITPLNRKKGEGNFYLQPNGVFYLTKNRVPVICPVSRFRNDSTIQYATQSGPMLVINSEINSVFKQGSANVYVRNGVGILPGKKLLFAISKEPVNFYDFALYFKNAGCINALYLDGFVSRAYIPNQNWLQTDGDFGVIIAAYK
ncbi:MAG: phosphodiester glycosidase family protein [Chitinophagales bacterium]